MENQSKFISLKEPVKAIKSEKYLVVLRDADGVEHYWLPSGEYDGYDRKNMKKKLLK